MPRSFSPADLKRLHDGEYALAMHATIAGAQKTLAISSAFRLQGGTPAGSCEGGTSADGHLVPKELPTGKFEKALK